MKKEVRKNILRQLYLRLEPVQLWSGVERANHDATRNIVRFLNFLQRDTLYALKINIKK